MLSLQVCRSAGLQVCRSASLQVCKSASLQIGKSASLQVCKSAVCMCRTPRKTCFLKGDSIEINDALYASLETLITSSFLTDCLETFAFYTQFIKE